MNWMQIKTNWNSVRDKVRARWPKLSDADLVAIDGRRDELVRRLEKRYHINRKKAGAAADTFARGIS